MKELATALPWVAFAAFLGLVVWISHQQYVAGYDSLFFHHKNPAELRLREAAVRRAELQAGIPTKP